MKSSPKTVKPIKGKIVLVKGFPIDSNATKIATYAYHYSSGDLDFVALLGAENGKWDMYTKSYMIGKNGARDYGLCQMNQKYQKHIVNTNEFWSSWEFQVEKCYELYKGGTVFYGKKNIPMYRKRLSLVSL